MRLFDLFKKDKPIVLSEEKFVTIPTAYTFNTAFASDDSSYRSSWVNQCIRVRAENVADCDMYMKDEITDDEIKGHPFIKAWKKANIYEMSGKQLLQIISTQLDVYGNAYLYVARVNGMPDEFIPLPSKFVMPVYNDMGTLIIGYQYMGSNAITYTTNDIIHFKNISIDNFLVGTPTIASLSKIINVDNLQQTYAQQTFVNSGTVSLALSAPGKLGVDVIDRLRNDFQSKHGGSKNAYKTFVMDGGMTIQDLSKTQKEMDYVESRKAVRNEILSRMSVPPVLVGVNESANRASSETEYDFFIRHTIVPIANNIETTLNTFITKNYNDNAELELEYDEQWAKTDIEAYDMLMKYGALTIDELREEFDFPPRADSEVAPNEDLTDIQTQTSGSI